MSIPIRVPLLLAIYAQFLTQAVWSALHTNPSIQAHVPGSWFCPVLYLTLVQLTVDMTTVVVFRTSMSAHAVPFHTKP